MTQSTNDIQSNAYAKPVIDWNDDKTNVMLYGWIVQFIDYPSKGECVEFLLDDLKDILQITQYTLSGKYSVEMDSDISKKLYSQCLNQINAWYKKNDSGLVDIFKLTKRI